VLINSDNIFLIGKTHKICEDYSAIFEISGIPCLVISDGCSSSKNTDIGSRILTWSAKESLLSMFTARQINDAYDTIGERTIRLARMTAQNLGVNKDSLDATLLVAYVKDGKIIICIYGDGIVFLEETSGIKTCDIIQFDNNTPYYLSYWDDPLRKKSFEIQCLFRSMKHLNKNLIDPQISISNPATPITYSLDVVKYKNIILSTDGVHSFISVNAGTENIFESEWLKIFDFKNYKGEFIKRRISKAVSEFSKAGISHSDDIGIAGFHIDSGATP
jgi:hypothetical protein